MKKLILLTVLSFLPFHFVNGAPEIKSEIVELITPKLNSDRITYFLEVMALNLSK